MPDAPIRVHELRAATRRRTSCASSPPPARPPSRPCAPTSSAPAADGAGGAGRRRRAPRCSSPILLRPQRPAHELPALSLAGGIAAVECARAFGADARLSWPNDVVCEDRKLAGVLAELGPGDSVLLGVGMNLASQAADLPPADRLAPTSLLLETGSAPGASDALTALLEALRPLAELFDAEGPPRSRRARAALDALAGPAVRARLASGEVVEGTAAGIADDGSLLVRAGDERARVRERRGRAAHLSAR